MCFSRRCFYRSYLCLWLCLRFCRILGEEKAQIDALVALVVALLLIGIRQPREIIVGIMPWMAVAIAVILVFLILYGFVAGDLSKAPDWMKITFGILAGLFTLAAVLYASGFGGIIMGWLSVSGNSNIWMNVLMIILVVGAMAVAMMSGKKKRDSD